MLICEFCGSKTIAPEENCPPPTLKLTLTLTQTLNPTGRKSSSEFRISTIKMLENHWAFFLTQLAISDLSSDKKPWIGLDCIEDREKNFSQGAKQNNHPQISIKNE